MAEIPLTRGMVALIDDADFELVSQSKWHARKSPHGKVWYAYRGSGHPRMMHRLIFGDVPSDIDHINRDGLDNRRSNLRAATRSQNIANSGFQKHSSAYRGVSWIARRGLWEARICDPGHKRRRLGWFVTEEAAALAYDLAAIERWGEYATLNLGPEMHAKGRAFVKDGAAKRRLKLTADDVRAIRAAYPELSQRKLAQQFGVTKRAIERVLSGEIWAWVE